ncbi:MAG: cobyrinate a,c-diamide synthase [Pseudomonadota bacterium]
MIKGFVIGATGSGTGKTTISLALLSFLKQKGYTVAPFKVGPDFIDPGHHALVSGKTSYNLDSWMLSKEYNRHLFAIKSSGADIAVVEGVMGLFDGIDGESEAGSTAQMAKWLGLPVVLVISAKGKARSAAAIVKGFETFDRDLNIAGVIFSMTGSERHYQYLKSAVEQNCTTRCLGHMPKNVNIVMPERHLGLVTADEAGISNETLSLLSDMVQDHMDIPGLIDSLGPIDLDQMIELQQKDIPVPASVQASGPVIAVARDKAFCFYYPDNLEILKQFGATIKEFSPLEDEQLPDNIDGIYFGGGYPEVYAEQLAEKQSLLQQIKTYSRSGMPIYGECGGFMVLCNHLSGMEEDRSYPMSGCFEFNVQMSKQLRSLGYREIRLKKDTIIGKKGDVIRGHEFHYSSLENPKIETENIYQVASRAGQQVQVKGYQVGNTLGSYLHLHFGSNPDCARQFVASCSAYKDNK